MKQKNKLRHTPQKVHSDIRKDFYKRLLYLGAGLIPIIIFLNAKGAGRYIAGAGFLFAMYQLIIIIGLSQLIVDDFFPPGSPYETIASPFNKFMYYFSTGFFFTGLVFLVFEIRKIDNMLNGIKLFWISGLLGIIAAVVVTSILKLRAPSVYYESKRRYTVHFGLFAGCFLLFPAAASFINRNFADGNTICKNYLIQRKSTGGKRNQSSWLFLKLENGSEERFDVSRDFYNQVKEGGEATLCTKKGKLGFEFVTNFKTAENW